MRELIILISQTIRLRKEDYTGPHITRTLWHICLLCGCFPDPTMSTCSCPSSRLCLSHSGMVAPQQPCPKERARGRTDGFCGSCSHMQTVQLKERSICFINKDTAQESSKTAWMEGKKMIHFMSKYSFGGTPREGETTKKCFRAQSVSITMT